MRTQRDSVSVVDIDWYSSEVPLLLFSNGTLRMMELNLKRSCSPMSEQDLSGTNINHTLCRLRLTKFLKLFCVQILSGVHIFFPHEKHSCLSQYYRTNLGMENTL